MKRIKALTDTIEKYTENNHINYNKWYFSLKEEIYKQSEILSKSATKENYKKFQELNSEMDFLTGCIVSKLVLKNPNILKEIL